jgi:aryl-alcohol dehydrogenase-like predicted oxidoreductase
MGGLLSERRLSGQPATESQADSKIAAWPTTISQQQAPLLKELSELASELGLSLSSLAISWAAARPAISSVILGARSVEQLKSGLKAIEFQFSAEILERFDRLCPPPPAPKPRFER